MNRAAVDLFLNGYERLYLITRELANGAHGNDAQDNEPDCDQQQAQDEARVVAGRTAIQIKRIFEDLFTNPDGVPPALVEELRYALAALVDEILLHELDWPGRQLWFDYLIEEQQYQTSIAGRRLFRQIDSLANRFADPAYLDQLATVYLMVLQLGFCGELRYQNDELADYRRHLNSLRLDAQLPEQICPQAYNHNQSGKEPQKLAAMRSWWRWIASGVVLFMLASFGVWVFSAQELKSVLKAQLEHEQTQVIPAPGNPGPASANSAKPAIKLTQNPPGSHPGEYKTVAGKQEVQP